VRSLQTFLIRLFNSAIIPIIIFEIIIIGAIMTTGYVQSNLNKRVIKETAHETFKEISKQISTRLDGLFNEVRKDVKTLSSLTEEILQYPMRYMNNEITFSYKEGFYIRDQKGVASVYATNIETLTSSDKMKLEQLSLVENVIDTIVAKRCDFIDSSWINIGSNYSLYYPEINITQELSPNLDPTKQAYYYKADSEHNPLKESRFIAHYNEPWALSLGQIGSMVAPIYAEDEFIGVVGATLTAENIQSITNVEMPFNAYMILVDEKNHLLFSSDEAMTMQSYGAASFFGLYKNGENASLHVVGEAMLNSPDNITFVQSIAGTSLRLYLFAKKSEVTKEIDQSYGRTQQSGLILLVVVVLFHIGFIWWMIRRIKRKSSDLAQPVSEMALQSNYLSSEKELGFKQSNIKEFDTLAKNLDIAHSKILEQLLFNSITKLPNRRKMLRDIDNNPPAALMLISLDNYRMICNVYGPDSGDELLCSLVDVFKSCTMVNNQMYHIYNDVFAVLISTIPEEGIKHRFMLFIDKMQSESVSMKSVSVTPSLSVGLVERSEDEETLGLLTKAEIALDSAIKDHHSMFVEFDSQKHSPKEFETNLEWAKKLKEAMNENRLVAYFQPIYNIKHDHIMKFESLVRMIDGDKVISPFFFLPVAEQIGALTEITKIMLENVFTVAQEYPDLEFSINTSFEDFEYAGILEVVKEMLSRFNIQPKNIIFEILETGTFSDEGRTTEAIKELKSLGFKIAIDDFGTGNSNFAHLTLMQVDYIKIDGQFIKDIVNDKSSQNITQTIKAYATLSGAEIIAEYVENGEILDKLESYDIEYAQGYHVSAPVPKEKISELLKYKRKN
jgi:EAL domain-containing protein (putative c-di-GMP-specific phosphodiesterase class I)/GGDEF domain-containing protein